MDDLVGKTVECHAMPEGSFYHAVRGTVEAVKNGWASVRATEVIDRWNITWQRHPSSCMTSVKIVNLEIIS